MVTLIKMKTILNIKLTILMAIRSRLLVKVLTISIFIKIKKIIDDSQDKLKKKLWEKILLVILKQNIMTSKY